MAALSACAPAAPQAEPSTSTTTSTPRPSAPATSTPSDDSATPDPTSTPSGPATEVMHGPRTGTSVALTFHGAGDPALAERILGAAEAVGARVSVLAVGTWLEQYTAVGPRILRGGHDLGNHTLHHRPMRTMSEATAYAEIVGGQRQVHRNVSGPSWFRPSGTPHATSHILAAASRAGYRTSLSFDVDPLDYTDPGASAVTSRVLAAVRPGSIVSLHLGHAGTAAALPAILSGLSTKGLHAVTVSELLTGVTP
jgi:peptidoglycan/xylan/chitin deacetylase (PgdA/CDA1 family)